MPENLLCQRYQKHRIYWEAKMSNTHSKYNGISKYLIVFSCLMLLLFAATPLASAKDANSIVTLREMGKAFADIAQKASPAVVSIKAKQIVKQDYSISPDWPFGQPFDPFEDDFFEYFFRRRMPQHPQQHQRKYYRPVQGSGFIISPDGYILTNNHVIKDTEEVTVTLVDKQEFTAKVVGTDPDSEVAVIKIDAKDLAYLQMADSDTLEVGEWVLAIGNPFGLSHTVTAGIVSAKGRSGVGLTAFEDFIQTDAAINPGNSGGPLINLDGQVVGINTAIATYDRPVNIGIGFAIPINMAKSVYDQLVGSGTVVRGFLGISMTELTPQLAEAFGLKDTKGVAITEVIEGSAAEKAGIKHNDIIIEFEGQPVTSANELRNKVAMLKPGAKVEIVILRDGKKQTLTAELGERPTTAQLTPAQPKALQQLGFSVQNLTPDLAEQLGYKDQTGVVVTEVEPGSLADIAGITQGALILEVNRQPVKNTDEFNKAIQQATDQRTVLLLIKDQRYTRFVVLTLPQK